MEDVKYTELRDLILKSKIANGVSFVIPRQNDSDFEYLCELCFTCLACGKNTNGDDMTAITVFCVTSAYKADQLVRTDDEEDNDHESFTNLNNLSFIYDTVQSVIDILQHGKKSQKRELRARLALIYEAL